MDRLGTNFATPDDPEEVSLRRLRAIDFNGNQRIDNDDLVAFQQAIDAGDPTVVGQPKVYDFSGDGDVDVVDVQFVFDNIQTLDDRYQRLRARRGRRIALGVVGLGALGAVVSVLR